MKRRQHVGKARYRKRRRRLTRRIIKNEDRRCKHCGSKWSEHYCP